MDKVLIVDDDLKFLDRLCQELQKYVGQIEVVSAPNGAKALEILGKERISVLVADQDMPQGSGLELLAHMRRRRPQTPCVVMTEPNNPSGVDSSDRDPIFRYIAKPFSPDRLFALIMEGLERLDEGVFWREYRNT